MKNPIKKICLVSLSFYFCLISLGCKVSKVEQEALQKIDQKKLPETVPFKVELFTPISESDYEETVLISFDANRESNCFIELDQKAEKISLPMPQVSHGVTTIGNEKPIERTSYQYFYLLSQIVGGKHHLKISCTETAASSSIALKEIDFNVPPHQDFDIVVRPVYVLPETSVSLYWYLLNKNKFSGTVKKIEPLNTIKGINVLIEPEEDSFKLKLKLDSSIPLGTYTLNFQASSLALSKKFSAQVIVTDMIVNIMEPIDTFIKTNAQTPLEIDSYLNGKKPSTLEMYVYQASSQKETLAAVLDPSLEKQFLTWKYTAADTSYLSDASYELFIRAKRGNQISESRRIALNISRSKN